MAPAAVEKLVQDETGESLQGIGKKQIFGEHKAIKTEDVLQQVKDNIDDDESIGEEGFAQGWICILEGNKHIRISQRMDAYILSHFQTHHESKIRKYVVQRPVFQEYGKRVHVLGDCNLERKGCHPKWP